MPSSDEFAAHVTGPPDALQMLLKEQSLGDEGAARLAASQWPIRLRELFLSECQIGPNGMRALAAVSWPNLHRLHLYNNPLGDDGAITIATSPGFAALRELELPLCDVWRNGALALAASTTLVELQRLNLRSNYPDGFGVSAFGSSCLPRLTALELCINNVEVLDAATLLAGPGLPNLSRLIVNVRVLADATLQRARRRGTLPVPGGNAMERALLDAIRDEPDDDAIRLIYADWIDDQGEANQAEFIRAQIEAERLPRDDARRAALEQRAAEIYRQEGRDWLEPALNLLGCFGHGGLSYRRGFPEEMKPCGGTWNQEMIWGLALYPIQTLHHELSDWPGDVQELLRFPRLNQLRTLVLLATSIQLNYSHGDIAEGESLIPPLRLLTEADAKLLAACPAIRGLRRLVLEQHEGMDPAARLVLEQAFGDRLEVR